MNAAATKLDLIALIDARPVSRFQVWMLVLLGASVVMDGFDAQAMGFVAPAIITAWGVDKVALGPVFGASLMGMLVGMAAAVPAALSCVMLFGLSRLRAARPGSEVGAAIRSAA